MLWAKQNIKNLKGTPIQCLKYNGNTQEDD